MLAGIPLAIVIALLAARPVARRLEIGPGIAFVLVLGFAGVLAITLLPQPLVPRPSADLTCLVPVIGLPAPARLIDFNDESLNVALFVPLGIALGLLVRHPRFPLLLSVAIALPWVIEAIQLAFPSLGRACQGSDLTDNLLGLLLGLAIGLIVAMATRFVRRES
jgi:hypothetical protein